MVAYLCYFVLSCSWGEMAKKRHAKTRQMVTFSCFRMATFRPATRKYDTFHASSFRLLLVVSLPGGVKGRHAKTRQNHHLAGFRVATFRVFAHVCRIFGRHAKTRQMVTFSCFRMATFRPATRKYATFHALRFRLLFVVSLPGEAKGRHAITRQNHHLAGFRVATFRVFAPKTRLYDMAQISHHIMWRTILKIHIHI